MNVYLYCHNNPINHIDPLGLETDEDDIEVPDSADVSRHLDLDDPLVMQYDRGEERWNVLQTEAEKDSQGRSVVVPEGNSRPATKEEMILLQKAFLKATVEQTLGIDDLGPVGMFLLDESMTDAAKQVQAMSRGEGGKQAALIGFKIVGTALVMEGGGRIAGKVARKLNGQKLLGTARDNLLNRAKNTKLRKAIDNLYRRGAEVGSGSSMDAVRFEKATGKLLSPKGHTQKLLDRRTQLRKLLRNPSLGASDKQITKDLLIDIQDALSQ